MEELSDDFKLSFRSTGKINEAFSAIVSRSASNRAIRYQGKKPHRAAVLNALVLWAASRPLEEQARIVGEGMDLLNRHLESDDADASAPIPLRPPAGDRVADALDPATGAPAPTRGSRRKRPSA